MQITKKNLSPTKIELKLAADVEFLRHTHEHVVAELAKDVNMAGFRKGHAPKALVEKSIDANLLQTQFLDHAVNDLYVDAVNQEGLRPVAQPEVSITKYVPFTALEFTASVEIVGETKLADYKKLKATRTVEPTTEKDISAVLADLVARDAEKKAVTRASKDGDEVVIDFSGVDAKTKEAIDGATGTAYPLTLGSGTFIPGFEPELVGLKPGEIKTFDITFPKDYGTENLQGKTVTFTVTVKAVNALTKPTLDDAFAKKVAGLKTLVELKADIRKQLESEKETQAQRAYENELVEKLASGTTIAIPQKLIDDEIDRIEAEEKRNLVYRGQTWQEHLKAEAKTEAEHHEGLREQAERRVKSGLALAEVAEQEGLDVSQAELDAQLELLKTQYTDQQMQAELAKPENRRNIASRILTEKTIARLAEYAGKH